MLDLFHSRVRAEQAIACIGRETPASQLDPERYTTPKYERRDYYEKIRVPALPDAARTEIRRGRDPIATFRRALRRLEVATALELVKAKAAFALSQSARKWLPAF